MENNINIYDLQRMPIKKLNEKVQVATRKRHKQFNFISIYFNLSTILQLVQEIYVKRLKNYK